MVITGGGVCSRKTVCIYTAELGFWLEVFFYRARRVNWVVFLGGILASELEDDFGTTGMFREEVRYIVDISVENDPAAV